MSKNYKYDRELCFILEPAPSKTGYNARQELQRIFDHVIEPTVSGRGMRIVRSSSLTNPHLITRQHQEYSTTAQILIANLSGFDPVVHYCLGRRHGELSNSGFNGDDGLVFLQHRAFGDTILDLPGSHESLIYYGGDPNVSFEDKLENSEYIAQANIKARQDLTRIIERLLLEKEQRGRKEYAHAEKCTHEPMDKEAVKNVIKQVAETISEKEFAGNAPHPQQQYHFQDIIARMQNCI